MPSKNIPEIGFGTSGLRGPAEGFTPEKIHAFISAFIATVKDNSKAGTIYVASDFRQSSPAIVRACIASIQNIGWSPCYAGNVPTPALADFAMKNNSPSLMVTGSHIPEEYNGIKFYRHDGELRKSDEQAILAKLKHNAQHSVHMSKTDEILVDPRIKENYYSRYTSVFSNQALQGLKVGIDLHSAVGGDMLVDILQALGAVCFPFARSEKFVAVDTEAMSKHDLERASEMMEKWSLDCVVSTDGDGDRPMIIGENGQQIQGDVLGAITAQALKIDCVVTPLSSTSAIEQSKWFQKTARTKIGSPYVVATMGELADQYHTVAGFEANGGFLLQSQIQLENGVLTPLPTRDAVLPILMMLVQSKSQNMKISELAKTLPPRFMKANRLKNIPGANAINFLNKIENEQKFRAKVDPILANPVSINNLDGIRMTLQDSSIIHFRQSGNAPEFRIYVETGNEEQAMGILNTLLEKIVPWLSESGAAS